MSNRPKDPKNARNKNMLVIGGSGSGKTRFFVKPNLMQMHSSYVVTDPKGQLLSEVGTMLRRGAPKLDENGKPMRDAHGKVIYEPYRIKVLNTINFKKSMKYNPFAYIRSRKGHPETGQCHHCQHQRRRRKILRRFLGECDSFAGGKKSADKQQNTVVWITGNSTGGMTGYRPSPTASNGVP